MPQLSNKRIISLDTETTGVDLRHGAEPFLVTIGLASGDVAWWEWDVNPETRKVVFPTEDLIAILRTVDEADEVVMQNSKFDITALGIACKKVGGAVWELFMAVLKRIWSKLHDTLIAGHLLASNHPHDLTSMLIEYRGESIQKWEDRLEVATKEAIKIVKREFPTWRLAAKGLPEMPSAKEKTWKYDSWIPRTLAKTLEGTGSDINGEWYDVLAEYANVDSAGTLALWRVQERLLKERGLWKLYVEKLKVVRVVADMERYGATISKQKLSEQRVNHVRERDEAGGRMIAMAAEREHELELPKGASPNGNLRAFCFDVLDLPRVYDPKAKTAEPTMGKLAAEEWLLLDPGPQLDFVKTMLLRTKRCTQVSYAESYERFWVSLPLNKCRVCDGTGNNVMSPCACSLRRDWRVLHGNLNPTGSDTLRFSHSNPNTANVSKQNIACFHCQGDGCDQCEGRGTERYNLRYAFGPAPGREWWCYDFENIELRVPGYESGERKMIELFERPDEPPYFGSYHLLNASIIFSDEFWPLAEKKGEFKKRYGAAQYQWTKNFGFAKQYNCGERTGDRSAHKAGAFQAVKKELPAVDALNDKYIKLANEHGYVETLPDKTVDPGRGYPLLCARGDYGRVKSTEPLCYHVSGTAMWCTIKAMNRCGAETAEWRAAGFDAWPILQVHDELVFDFPRGENLANKPKALVLKKLMERSGDDIGIPTPVSMSYHPDTWAEGRSV